jgi:hypothetical protein
VGFENGHLLRVVLQAQVGADSQVMVLHYDLQNATAGNDNDPQQLADDFRDDVVPAFAALYNSAWTIPPVLIEDEKDPLNPTDPRSSWSSGTTGAGTKTGTATEQLPRACCAVATLKTDNIGRRHTGRIFLGGTTLEGDQNAGNWTGSGIVSLWDALLAAIPREPDIAAGVSDATAKWCVYSRTQRAANLDPYASAINAVVRRGPVHWLRSREGG